MLAFPTTWPPPCSPPVAASPHPRPPPTTYPSRILPPPDLLLPPAPPASSHRLTSSYHLSLPPPPRPPPPSHLISPSAGHTGPVMDPDWRVQSSAQDTQPGTRPDSVAVGLVPNMIENHPLYVVPESESM